MLIKPSAVSVLALAPARAVALTEGMLRMPREGRLTGSWQSAVRVSPSSSSPLLRVAPTVAAVRGEPHVDARTHPRTHRSTRDVSPVMLGCRNLGSALRFSRDVGWRCLTHPASGRYYLVACQVTKSWVVRLRPLPPPPHAAAACHRFWRYTRLPMMPFAGDLDRRTAGRLMLMMLRRVVTVLMMQRRRHERTTVTRRGSGDARVCGSERDKTIGDSLVPAVAAS